MAPQTLRLTWNEHIAGQLLTLWESKPHSPVFSDLYMSDLRKAIERIEGWQLGLYALQIPFVIYLGLSLSQTPAELSIWGIKSEHFIGLRESGVIFLSFCAMVQQTLGVAKDTRASAVHTLLKLRYSEEERHLIRLAFSERFFLDDPLPKSSPNFTFHPRIGLWPFKLLALTAYPAVLAIAAFAVLLQLAIWIDVCKHLSLPWKFEIPLLLLSLLFIIGNFAAAQTKTAKLAFAKSFRSQLNL